uniref:ARAD1B21274p n=1 Tax=Blastobotrys adeninivorans TaxID=409370 RepID=A0A060T7P2_BLAAD
MMPETDESQPARKRARIIQSPESDTDPATNTRRSEVIPDQDVDTDLDADAQEINRILTENLEDLADEEDSESDSSDIEIVTENKSISQTPAAEYFDDDDDNDDDDDIEILTSEEKKPQNLVQRKQLSNFTCSICYDEPEIVAVTPCGHLYCSECVFRALCSSVRATKYRGECSICRKKVPFKQVKYLEFKMQARQVK